DLIAQCGLRFERVERRLGLADPSVDESTVPPPGNLHARRPAQAQDPVHRQESWRRHLPDGRTEAAPWPKTWVANQARPYGIEHDVTANLAKIGLAVDQLGPEPPLQEVPTPLMPSVESLGVDAIDLPHGNRKICLRRLEQQVIVVAHQTVGMATHMMTS